MGDTRLITFHPAHACLTFNFGIRFGFTQLAQIPHSECISWLSFITRHAAKTLSRFLHHIVLLLQSQNQNLGIFSCFL
ncbi:Hypothetical predicted protein [Cloeon dipterum]|uniref:Uncharacterized protein n=1 Tax=Cloeon dipterum TaxID=197152 RepID=A0A8S1DSP3_9INSE|nr:Hypothetical predicted protein [Cloeon dipterum]